MGKSLIITTGGGTDIEEGNPNATRATVLQGYTLFVGPTDDPVVGEMVPQYPNGGTNTMNVGGSFTIPGGYYNGTYRCTAKALKDFTGATASAGHVLQDKTGWKDGAKIVGAMTNRSKVTNALGANGTYTIPSGWHNGSGAVSQSLSTQGATNVTPGTTQKTVVVASRWTTGTQIVLGNGNLVAGNIKKDVTIFGVRGTWIVDSRDLANGVYLVQNGEIGLNGRLARYGDTEDWELSKTGLNSEILSNLRNSCIPPYREGNCLVFTSMHWDRNSGGGTNSNLYSYVGWSLTYRHRTAIDNTYHYLAADVDKISWSVAYKNDSTAVNWFCFLIRSNRQYWIAGKYSNALANNSLGFHGFSSGYRATNSSGNFKNHWQYPFSESISPGFKASAKPGVSYDPNACDVSIDINFCAERAAQIASDGDWSYGSRHGVIVKLWLRNLWEHN